MVICFNFWQLTNASVTKVVTWTLTKVADDVAGKNCNKFAGMNEKLKRYPGDKPAKLTNDSEVRTLSVAFCGNFVKIICSFASVTVVRLIVPPQMNVFVLSKINK